jgi:hypothetical protein
VDDNHSHGDYPKHVVKTSGGAMTILKNDGVRQWE